jgi:hypothetical protein
MHRKSLWVDGWMHRKSLWVDVLSTQPLKASQMVGPRYHVLPITSFQKAGGGDRKWYVGCFSQFIENIANIDPLLHWVDRLLDGYQNRTLVLRVVLTDTRDPFAILPISVLVVFFWCWILAAWRPPPKKLIFFNRCLVFLPKKIERNLSFWRNVANFFLLPPMFVATLLFFGENYLGFFLI